ncbi:MAG: DUF2892 domain-containing protein [Chromatiales bacterium]|jgi:hypothetical protein
MNQNVGMIDRILRILVGIALLVWGFLLSEPYNYWGLIGVIPLFTALIGWCPAYSMIGIKTKK